MAQDAVIVERDCGSERGLTVRPKIQGGEVIVPLEDRILGRCLAADAVDPKTGEVLLPRNKLIDEQDLQTLDAANVDEVMIRSVLTVIPKTAFVVTAMVVTWHVARRSTSAKLSALLPLSRSVSRVPS